jgi:hypothetical protein
LNIVARSTFRANLVARSVASRALALLVLTPRADRYDARRARGRFSNPFLLDASVLTVFASVVVGVFQFQWRTVVSRGGLALVLGRVDVRVMPVGSGVQASVA